MNHRHLFRVMIGVLFLLIPWLLYNANIAAFSNATYEVVTHRELYLPAEPFHITDTRDPPSQRCNFETRTVIVLQPHENGQPLQDRPVVMFVHGGGWTNDYADWYTDILTPALTVEQGWVVVNVDYRLTSNQVYHVDGETDPCNPANPTKAAWYDDNLQDVAAAFAWTVQNIKAYGGDPQNIFLFGHSAGGHLVSLLATHSDYRTLRDHMRGVISMSGAYDLKNLSHVFDANIAQTFPGGRADQAALDEASPLTYVRAGETLPPLYVLYCENDIPSLPEQATTFYNQLDTLGYDAELDYLKGYTHVSEMAAIADSQETVTQHIIAYIKAHIRKTIYLPLIVHNMANLS
jgi:acetyl esterase/lipase